MPHDVSLIATIAAGFGLALVFGFIAIRLRMPPLVGYLLAGILISPTTPGFVADVGLAGQLAEIGVMLLMFGVGLHFSLDDLMAVRGIAVPGAIVQIAAATVLGLATAMFWGWDFGPALVFGLCLSGKVEKLIAARVEWKDGKMVEVPGSEFEMKADLVLLAMGFVSPVSSVLDAFGVDKDARGNAKATTDGDGCYQTSVPKVFAAGDMRRGQSLVVWAIREGRQCARAVDEFLMGSSVLPR